MDMQEYPWVFIDFHGCPLLSIDIMDIHGY